MLKRRDFEDKAIRLHSPDDEAKPDLSEGPAVLRCLACGGVRPVPRPGDVPIDRCGCGGRLEITRTPING